MKTTVKQLIKEHIAQEVDYIREHKEILEILKPLDGKPINGRTLNDKRLNGYTFKPQYGMFYIVGKYEHLIGYSSSPTIDTEKFKDWDACNGSAAEKRIEQLKNMDVKEFERIAKKIDKAFNELRYLFGDLENKNLGSFHNPVYYETLKSIFDENEGQSNEIQLYKFYYIRKQRP